MPAAPKDRADIASQPLNHGRPVVVMAVLLLIFFLATSDNQMISPLLPLMGGEFGRDVGHVGEAIGPAYALAAAAAALLAGPVSDSFGRRVFLLYASLVFAASLLLVPFVDDLALLAALRLFTGLAAGVFSTCSIAYVGDYFPYKRRGMAMSVVQSGYFLAFVLGVPIANSVGHWQGWRSSFAVFGLLAVAAFAMVAFLLPKDQPFEPDLSNRVARRFHNIRMAVETRARIASVAAAFFVSGGFVGFMFYLGSWLKESLALRANQVSLVFVLVGIASLAGVALAGTIADRYSKRGISIISTVVLAVLLVVIPHLGWGVGLFAAFLLASVAFAFRQGPLQALATELVPREARGALIAARNTASQIGIAISTVVAGLIYDRSGYELVGLLSAAATLCAAGFIVLMKEPERGSQLPGHD